MRWGVSHYNIACAPFVRLLNQTNTSPTSFLSITFSSSLADWDLKHKDGAEWSMCLREGEGIREGGQWGAKGMEKKRVHFILLVLFLLTSSSLSWSSSVKSRRWCSGRSYLRYHHSTRVATVSIKWLSQRGDVHGAHLLADDSFIMLMWCCEDCRQCCILLLLVVT